MTFLSLLKSIPKDGDISPELDHKLKKAANMLLAGREGGNVDVPDRERNNVDYEDLSGLDDLSEPEMIEDEEAATTDRANFEPDESGDDEDEDLTRRKPRCTLITYDDRDRIFSFFEGSRREVNQTKARLDLIRIKKGHEACKKEVKKLREKYLSQTMGDFYEKGSCSG